MTESSLEGVPEPVREQITSRSSTEPEPAPWQVSLSPSPPPDTSRRHFAPVIRRITIPSASSASSDAADDDLFSQPTRVTRPESLVRSHPRRRYGMWAGATLFALLASAGVVRAMDSERDQVTDAPAAAPAAPVVIPTQPTLGAPHVENGGIVGDGPCRLAVRSTPAGATVAVDGIETAIAPATLATSCGTHRIDISHPTHATMTVLGTLVDGQPELMDVTLSRRIDVVSVFSRPANAMIYIDGQLIGRTPRRLDVLGHVPVTLELRKPGYKNAYAEVNTINPRNTLTVQLARERSRQK